MRASGTRTSPRRRWQPPVAGWVLATSSCTGWSTSGSKAMDAILDILAGVFADGSALMLAVLVFLATATLTFGILAAVWGRGAVKRRTAAIAGPAGPGPAQDQG